jgi:hypothetical protein
MCPVWEGRQAAVLFCMPLHPLLFFWVPEYVVHHVYIFGPSLTASLESDWKTHKKSCKRFSAANTITVKPNYEGWPIEGLIPNQQLARVVSGFPSPPVSELLQRPSQGPMEYPKKKIVKVQIPRIQIPDAPIVVYDAKREFLCFLLRRDTPAEYDRLTELVQSKGTFGLKAYLAADLKSKDELIIKIDDVLAEQPF